MDEQRQDDQLEPTYNSSMPIQGVALKTYRKRWTIEKGGRKGSGRSVLIARHDDVDVWFQAAASTTTTTNNNNDNNNDNTATTNNNLYKAIIASSNYTLYSYISSRIPIKYE